jgi:GNAT superfamily N-acetyltransferase
MNDLNIRSANADDVPAILAFIKALAEYEKLSHQVTATEAQLRSTLFGAKPAAQVLIAEWQGQPAGIALYFNNYSTFLAKPGIYLEDLFVYPEYRGKGIGKALLIALARICVERGYGRLEWSVLDWNTPAIEFYRSMGAVLMDEWTINRVTGDALQRMASM